MRRLRTRRWVWSSHLLPSCLLGAPLGLRGWGRPEVQPGVSCLRRGGKLVRKTRVWNVSPPSPAGCLPRGNYFGLSSRVQPPMGGGCSRGRGIHFRGRGPRAPGGRHGQAWAAPPPLAAAQADWGRGGRCSLGLERPRLPQQAPGSAPEVFPGPWGRPRAGGALDPSFGPSGEPCWGPPRVPEALAPGPGGLLRPPSRTSFRDTPWMAYSHLVLPKGDRKQVGV